MFSEQQEMKKRMEEEFRMKEDRLQQSLACLEESLTLVEVRERGWQQEREEILQEVQRLKASAANRSIGEVVQSRRRPLLGPSHG